MADLRIDKGVPIPDRRHSTKRFRFQDMEVGDSIFYPSESPASDCNLIRSSARYQMKTHPGVAYVVRQVPGGVRYWRTA